MKLVGRRIHHISDDYGDGVIKTARVWSPDDIRVEIDFDNGRETTNFNLQKCIDKGILSLVDGNFSKEELLALARNGDQSGIIIKWEFESDETKDSESELLDKWEYGMRLNRPYYLYKYIPVRLFDFFTDEEVYITKTIWRYKDGYDQEFAFFTDELQKKIVEIAEEKDPNKITLVPVPTSEVNRLPITGRSISVIVSDLNRTGTLPSKKISSGDGLIVRTENVKTAHLQESASRPSMEDHIRTMECKESNLPSDTLFILVDDVYTTGETMKACRYLLESSKVPPENICYLTIGRTVSMGW